MRTTGNKVFGQLIVGTVASTPTDVIAADVDKDGDLDILSASFGDDRIDWYENDGQQAFTAHSISTSADFASSVEVADVDGDGDLDVLSASTLDDKIAWYENDGSEGFSERVISTSAAGAYGVSAADIDGDGDLDVLSASFTDDSVVWYENDGSQIFSAATLDSLASGAKSVTTGDVDGDGDFDVLAGIQSGGRITWYEQVGYDFGDAPAPYDTLIVEDGARHVVTGPFLGSSRDEEADGFHSEVADADGADEDGVQFGGIAVGETLAALTVLLEPGVSGKVDAWIDFDRDQDWDDPSDQILNSVDVDQAMQTLNFNLPGGLAAGDTYARIRISTDGGLGPIGEAPDGEVEDYLINIFQAPKVEAVVINGGDAQRSSVSSIRVEFDQEVSIDFSGGADVFEFRNEQTSEIATDVPVVGVENGKTFVDFTFSPGPTVNSGGGLTDGDYILTIDSTRITKQGIAIDGDGDGLSGGNHTFGSTSTDGFYRKYGDQNGSGLVDLLDFAAFRQTFGKSTGDNGYEEGLDFDLDNTIGLLDFAAFRQRFGA